MADSNPYLADNDAEIHQFDAEAVNAAARREPLFAARRKIHPKRAEGQFRRLKWLIMAVTLGIYYVTPWIRWDRGPYAPDQAVLIDFVHRRFYFFFIEIWPQEFFYVAGMLIMAGLGLFLVTSVVGRAWCGYTCPQTVWVDLFLVVERFFEGDRNARIALDKAPWSASKLRKRLLKHIVWLLIAISTGGAWIFYFADAPTLLGNLIAFEAPFIAYATIAVLTFTTYTLGGFLREQVCTYMCPWPRIQAAMLDEHSLVVTYNDWRGEPRSRHAKRAAEQGQKLGDCVDCNACVAVCPMGIDIRDGQQIECITCALCIDACNGVMDKLGRERGLISYATLNDYNTNMGIAIGPDGRIDPARVHTPDGHIQNAFKRFDWQIMLRPRSLLYFAVWGSIGLAMLYVLFTRSDIDASLIANRNPLFVRLSDNAIQNSFEVKVANKLEKPRMFILSLEGLPGAVLQSAGIDNVGERSVLFAIEPDRVRSLRVTIRQPADDIAGERTPFDLLVREVAGRDDVRLDGVFNAPTR